MLNLQKKNAGAFMSRFANLLIFLLLSSFSSLSLGQNQTSSDAQACEDLVFLRNLTITLAQIRDNDQSENNYCYVRGIISPAIHFHAQLPLSGNWNGRFLQWGDGGKDGDLDYANHRVAEGYAVTNSNLGHDNGVEPGASFAFNNRQAEIDFGYRAVHLTVMAGKRLVNEYTIAVLSFPILKAALKEDAKVSWRHNAIPMTLTALSLALQPLPTRH